VDVTTSPSRTPGQIRRWRQYLADERSEAAGYRRLAERRTGEERDILLALADAEKRHESHWLELLGDDVGPPRRSSLRTRLLVFLTAHFGAVFVLALMQRAEGRSPYETEVDATDRMAADERIHGEVLRGLAARGRERLSGTFRAAVFGANDGLVSNLALVLGIGATGAASGTCEPGSNAASYTEQMRFPVRCSVNERPQRRQLPWLKLTVHLRAAGHVRARGASPAVAVRSAPGR